MTPQPNAAGASAGRGSRATDGKQPARWKRMFWYFAPVQSSVIVRASNNVLEAQSYPSPRVSTLGHVLYALFWIGAVAAYSIFVTYQHFTKPDVANFMHEPAKNQPLPLVAIEAFCSRPGNCGAITITADYTDAPAYCRDGARAAASSPSIPWTRSYPACPNGMNGTAVELPLCYTGEAVFSTYTTGPMPAKLGIIVDFAWINTDSPTECPTSGPNPAPAPPPYTYYPPAAAQAAAAAAAAVEVAEPVKPEARDFAAQDHHALSSASTGVVRITGPGGLLKVVNLEAWQVKTVVMGQAVTYENDEFVSATVHPIATQYEGRRPNTKRATAIIGLAEFADVTRIEHKAGDVTFVGWMGLLGTMCGMAFFMNSMQCFFEPCFVRLFPGPAELARREAAKKAAEGEGGERVGDMEKRLLDGDDELPMSPQMSAQLTTSTVPFSSDSMASAAKSAAPLPPNAAASTTHL